MSKPLQQRSPAEHAAMGWRHGQYKGGYCLALSNDDSREAMAIFMAQTKERGAEYIDLTKLPEYRG